MKVGLNLVNLKSERNEIQKNNPKYIVNNSHGTSFGQLSQTQADAIKSLAVPSLRIKAPSNISSVVSFTGNSAKNLNQVVMVAPEYQDLHNKIYKIGGYGNVAGEASVAFHQQGGLDIRTILPYHSPNNDGGQIKIQFPLLDEHGKQVIWDVPVKKGGEIVSYNKIPGYGFRAVDLDYQLKEGENFVIHGFENAEAPWEAGYKVIERTGIEGSVKAVNDNLTGVDNIPYHLFQVVRQGAEAKKDLPPIYIIHMQDLAKFAKPYNADSKKSLGAYGADGFSDLFYQNFSRATNDALQQMNTDEYGNFNPASWWLGDRFDAACIVDASEQSAKGNTYFDGLRIHNSYHNPGKAYQGRFRNPIDFLRLIGSEDDLNNLKKHPEYGFVQEMIKKIEDAREQGDKFDPAEILSKEELERLDTVFKPVFGEFVDDYGNYNLSMVPIVAARQNPHNMTFGTVSINYGKEMRNHNTTEIAPGLTKHLGSTRSIDITNGSTASSLKLDQFGDFGEGNGITQDMIEKGFTPLTKDVTGDVEKFYSARQSNKKWMLDIIGDANEKGNSALQKLFFPKKAINEGSTVIGGISKYKEGDMLFVGWGRADDQKGFPTTLETFLQYFKDENVPKETKLKTKVLIGAGAWDPKARDWQLIQDRMKEIAELDGGAYKNNVCYLNGRFSNRIVACADYSIITSRYEPCGITPLESFAGGTPVISNKTGGSPDYITSFVKGAENKHANGFLTEHAFLVNPEVIGKEAGLVGDQLDDARIAALGAENVKCLREAVEIASSDTETYKKMMTNAFGSKIGWHENAAFNGGKSAIERYTQEAWNIVRQGDEYVEIPGLERNLSPLSNIKGSFDLFQRSGVRQPIDVVNDKLDNIIDRLDGITDGNSKKIKGFLENMSFKGQIALAAGAAAVVLSVAHAVITRENTKKEQQEEQEMNPAKYVPSVPVNTVV